FRTEIPREVEDPVISSVEPEEVSFGSKETSSVDSEETSAESAEQNSTKETDCTSSEVLPRESNPLIPIPITDLGIVSLDPRDVLTEVKTIPVYVNGQRVLSIPFSGTLDPNEPKELYLTPEEFAML